jgi:electron transfer flavoprotein beta subunit
LNIVALVKYSLDIGEVKVDPATSALRLAGVPRRVGNIDKNVVEGAVRLKESVGEGATLKALSLGPVEAKDAFKDVLAMGVDEVVLVEDPFDGEEEGGVAVRILEAALRRLEPVDVVVCGFASDDGYSQQVPSRLAERTGRPLLANVRSLTMGDGTLTAHQNLEDRVQTVAVPMPAVVSVDEEAFPPRRTTLMDALKARQKPVHQWSVEDDLGLAIADLAAASHVAEVRVRGVVVNRRQQVLRGSDMGELAGRFIEALVEAGALKGGNR